jgi:hypothetical protein
MASIKTQEWKNTSANYTVSIAARFAQITPLSEGEVQDIASLDVPRRSDYWDLRHQQTLHGLCDSPMHK